MVATYDRHLTKHEEQANDRGGAIQMVHPNTNFKKSFYAVYCQMYIFLDSIDGWRFQSIQLPIYKKNMELLIQLLMDLRKIPCDRLVKTEIEQTFDILCERREISNQTDFESLFRELIVLYVSFSKTCRVLQLPSRTLRYSNTFRSIFHACTAVTVISAYEFILAPYELARYVSITAAVLCWIGESFKYHSEWFMSFMVMLLGPCAREHEFSTINSATWYTTALAIMAVVFPSGPHSMIALAVLGLGDPWAAYVGKRYGTIYFQNGKSVQGLCGFILFATIGAIFYQYLFCPYLTCTSMIVLALVASIAGGVAEILSEKIDDNFTIPLAAAVASYVTYQWLLL